jgi:outer membrane protein OmpA-like peptidoglycan-associated protein
VRRASLFVLVLLLSGCAATPVVVSVAPNEGVVLLPGADGHTGALTVTHGNRSETLASPYATASLQQEGRLETGSTTAEQVRSTYGAALDAQPPRPMKFRLYFLENSDELTADSKVELAKILPALANYPAPEIVVVGHTDRVGTVEYNDALSLRRADRMRGELVKIGVPADRIQTAGRGEREPLVPTADEVMEPRNRRVEVTVR